MISAKKLTTAWHRLREDEDGSIAVETLLMVPLLAWALLSTLVYFDAYRTEAISEKAALTIADMLSRETGFVNDNYMTGASDLLTFLALHDPNPELRVTVFRSHGHSTGNPHFHRVWSKTQNSTKAELTTQDIRDLADEGRLPNLGDQERAILVETWTDYQAPWKSAMPTATRNFGMVTNLDDVEMRTFTLISPRFSDSLCWNNDPGEDPAQSLC